ENGIRSGHVTGVQTCALPIYEQVARSVEREIVRCPKPARWGGDDPLGRYLPHAERVSNVQGPGTIEGKAGRTPQLGFECRPTIQIGRASCRDIGVESKTWRRR